jgi:TPP-dependent pyruvate/acetoin dehydrogenase alpha subunit
VFICENNLYAITVPVSKSLPIKNVSKRVLSYGIPGKTVDGMDILAVYKAVCEAVEKARQGNGPSLIECKTYRFKGHWIGDPIVYRTDEELQQWQKKDPILKFRKFLVKEHGFTAKELDSIKNKVEGEVKEAVAFAKNSPFPESDEVDKYVYYQ